MSHHRVVVTDLRRSIADAVRTRVAGPDARSRAGELWATPGERWFTPDRPIFAVHADAAMFVGGLRALLLQSLHPLAMAGVAQHSDYRADPWGRLQRTADFLAATTFGPATEADKAVARVRSAHRRVQGLSRDGRPYSAGDPHLLRWVHVAEVDSFLQAHQHYGAERLSDEDASGYVADMARIARGLGVPDPPTDLESLRLQLRAYRPELTSTPEAPRRRALLVRAALAPRGPSPLCGARRCGGEPPAVVGPAQPGPSSRDPGLRRPRSPGGDRAGRRPSLGAVGRWWPGQP